MPAKSRPAVKPVLRQTLEEFEGLRGLIFPWSPEDADRHPMASVDAEAADQSTTITFRASKRMRDQLNAYAEVYGLTLSEFLRRLAYGVSGAYGSFSGPVSADREGE